MKIAFRTDASLQIGTGHVMRCLTLANALRERGAECRFVCREHPGNLLELIRKQGFDAVALPVQANEMQAATEAGEHGLAHTAWLGADWYTDAEQTKIGMGASVVDWLIVDHYALDERWESSMRTYCNKIMVIDDLADRSHDCDLLLDQNLVADMACRYDGKLPEHCGRMLGPEYALLQPQYADLHPRTPPREDPVRRVLVYFGGADTDNLTGRAVAAFIGLGRTDIALDVVINSASFHAAAIRQQVGGHAEILLHSDLPSLAPLMVRADLAIGAGGATSWERCCLGLPALVVTLAENQKPVAAELDRRGLARWLGHQDEVTVSILSRELNEALGNAKFLRECSIRAICVIDGHGINRVCDALKHQDFKLSQEIE